VLSANVLLGVDDRADAGEALHQALRAEQVEGLADGVARGAVVGADGGLVRQGAVREAAGQHLVAEQVGELPGPVGAQPAPAGGDGGRALAGVVSDAFRGHAADHTDGAWGVVLLECCATWGWGGDCADLGFARVLRKICHRRGAGAWGLGPQASVSRFALVLRRRTG